MATEGASVPYAWKRAGEMLEQARIELDIRYRNLTLFTSERGIDYRLCWDIEHGSRANYRRSTLSAIESAYGVPRGTISRTVEAAVSEPDADDRPQVVRENWDDEIVRVVWSKTSLSPGLRRGFIEYYLARRDADESRIALQGQPSGGGPAGPGDVVLHAAS